MYLSGWDYELPEARARYRQDELRSRDFMILRMRQEGGVIDEAFDRPPATGRATEWSRLRFVLAGRVHVRAGGATFDEGTVYGSADYRAERGRALTRASDWLDLYWRHESALGARLGGDALFRLTPESTARVAELTSALEQRDLGGAQRHTTDLLTELRAGGVPVEPEALTEAASGAARRDRRDRASPDFAKVLWQLARRLSEQPMAVDLSRALGVCERQALRRARAHFEQFHVSASSWREFLSRLRVEMGTFFMSAPSARTEDVSRFLGFSSPTGFCHALKDAGLPSPLAIQTELRCA